MELARWLDIQGGRVRVRSVHGILHGGLRRHRVRGPRPLVRVGRAIQVGARQSKRLLGNRGGARHEHHRGVIRRWRRGGGAEAGGVRVRIDLIGGALALAAQDQDVFGEVVGEERAEAKR